MTPLPVKVAPVENVDSMYTIERQYVDAGSVTETAVML
jgi:hypothetical protein